MSKRRRLGFDFHIVTEQWLHQCDATRTRLREGGFSPAEMRHPHQHTLAFGPSGGAQAASKLDTFLPQPEGSVAVARGKESRPLGVSPGCDRISLANREEVVPVGAAVAYDVRSAVRVTVSKEADLGSAADVGEMGSNGAGARGNGDIGVEGVQHVGYHTADLSPSRARTSEFANGGCRDAPAIQDGDDEQSGDGRGHSIAARCTACNGSAANDSVESPIAMDHNVCRVSERASPTNRDAPNGMMPPSPFASAGVQSRLEAEPGLQPGSTEPGGRHGVTPIEA